ncbi:MAG: T9SS type A sorting domain-containing protein [Chlorobi bacterium]|nr:T9SS type A sorting domain-containing protein [Chlorobiota bacterium]
MKKYYHLACIFLIALILLPALGIAQTSIHYPVEVVRAARNTADLARIPEQIARGDIPVGDMIVGYPNPNEVREINTDFTWVGRIIVLNNGVLKFNSIETTLEGDIIVLNNGKVEINEGLFTITQHFLYEHSLIMMNTASFHVNNAVMQFSNFPFSIGITDSSALVFTGAELSKGGITLAAMRYARFHAISSKNVGENLFFDNARGVFEDCEGILTWFNIPKGAEVDFTLPPRSISGTWIYPDSARVATGVHLRVEYRRCYNIRTAIMSHTGSKLRVSNSDILAFGSLIRYDKPLKFEGFVNKVDLQNFRFPSPERDIVFTNCRVGAWNFYPSKLTQFTLSGSVFGELLAMGRARATVMNSFCDGTGGYIGSMDTTEITLVLTQVTTQVNVRNYSRMFVILSTIVNSTINVDGNGLLALLNSNFSAPPTVGPSSAAVVMSIDEPSAGYTGGIIPVYGTARLILGRDIPVFMRVQWLDYGLTAQPQTWYKITQPSSFPKYREKLADWDATNLQPGVYTLRLNMELSSGDTIETTRQVVLQNRPVDVKSVTAVAGFELFRNYPNPAESMTTIGFRVPEIGDRTVTLDVVDAFGRKVMTLVQDEISPGYHEYPLSTAGFSRGVYYYRLRTSGGVLTRPFLVK